MNNTKKLAMFTYLILVMQMPTNSCKSNRWASPVQFCS